MARPTTRTAQMAADADDGVVIEGRADNPLIPLDDLDTEESWDQWIDDLKGAEATGTVHVYKLPTDSEGNAIMTKGSRQTYLMSCPHQQYTFEELIALIKSKFMQPGEWATIRITGRRSGARGVMFNRVVPIQRESGPAGGNVPEGGNLMGVLQAMQNQNRQTAEMVERIIGGHRLGEITPQKPASDTIKEWLGILGPIVAPVLLAYVNRPQPKSDLESMIGAVIKLKDLAGEGNGGSSDDESTTLGIVKAVAGPGLQLLNTLAQNKTPAIVQRRGRPVPQGISPAQPQALPSQRGTAPNRGASQATPGPIPIEAAPVGGLAAPAVASDPGTSSLSASQSAPPSENHSMLAQLAPQLEQLATLAEQGADPVEVSKLVFDMLPQSDEVDAQLYSIVADKSAFNRLALLAPKMKAHADWFERLRLAMLTEFSDDEKEQA